MFSVTITKKQFLEIVWNLRTSIECTAEAGSLTVKVLNPHLWPILPYYFCSTCQFGGFSRKYESRLSLEFLFNGAETIN